MSDPKFFKSQGFEVIDEAPTFFKLFGFKLNKKADWPQIKSTAKKGKCRDNGGITVYYSDTCPFNDFYVNVSLQQYAGDDHVVTAAG